MTFTGASARFIASGKAQGRLEGKKYRAASDASDAERPSEDMFDNTHASNDTLVKSADLNGI